jgi:hypothetical protein
MTKLAKFRRQNVLAFIENMAKKSLRVNCNQVLRGGDFVFSR